MPGHPGCSRTTFHHLILETGTTWDLCLVATLTQLLAWDKIRNLTLEVCGRCAEDDTEELMKELERIKKERGEEANRKAVRFFFLHSFTFLAFVLRLCVGALASYIYQYGHTWVGRSGRVHRLATLSL